jgi:hypothetical protein
MASNPFYQLKTKTKNHAVQFHKLFMNFKKQ